MLKNTGQIELTEQLFKIKKIYNQTCSKTVRNKYINLNRLAFSDICSLEG